MTLILVIMLVLTPMLILAICQEHSIMVKRCVMPTCKRVYGIKDGLGTWQVTHGYCSACEAIVTAQVEAYCDEYEAEAKRMPAIHDMAVRAYGDDYDAPLSERW